MSMVAAPEVHLVGMRHHDVAVVNETSPTVCAPGLVALGHEVGENVNYHRKLRMPTSI